MKELIVVIIALGLLAFISIYPFWYILFVCLKRDFKRIFKKWQY